LKLSGVMFGTELYFYCTATQIAVSKNYSRKRRTALHSVKVTNKNNGTVVYQLSIYSFKGSHIQMIQPSHTFV
jgi:hypothetical protein